MHHLCLWAPMCFPFYQVGFDGAREQLRLHSLFQMVCPTLKFPPPLPLGLEANGLDRAFAALTDAGTGKCEFIPPDIAALEYTHGFLPAFGSGNSPVFSVSD